MSTLSNVSKSGDYVSPCVGRDSFVPAGNYTSGVSVDCARTQEKCWFVLRVSYGRIEMVREFLSARKTEFYIPMQHCRKMVAGKRKIVMQPLLPNFVFVWSTYDEASILIREFVVKGHEDQHYLSFYYNHFVTTANGSNPPLVVPDSQMSDFMLATSSDSEHVMLVSPHNCHFKSGQTVIITDGQFKGVRGKVARVSGQQRVVVHIAGLCMIATAYIPSAFIHEI